MSRRTTIFIDGSAFRNARRKAHFDRFRRLEETIDYHAFGRFLCAADEQQVRVNCYTGQPVDINCSNPLRINVILRVLKIPFLMFGATFANGRTAKNNPATFRQRGPKSINPQADLPNAATTGSRRYPSPAAAAAGTAVPWTVLGGVHAQRAAAAAPFCPGPELSIAGTVGEVCIKLSEFQFFRGMPTAHCVIVVKPTEVPLRAPAPTSRRAYRRLGRRG